MGVTVDEDWMNIIFNSELRRVDPWLKIPPWVLVGERALWDSWDQTTFFNSLQQTVEIEHNTDYFCSLDFEIVGLNRRVFAYLGNYHVNWLLPAGVYHREWIHHPEVGNTAEILVNRVAVGASKVFVDNFFAYGIPADSSIYGFWFNNGFSFRKTMQFHDFSPVNGDKMFRACNVADRTNILIRYTP